MSHGLLSATEITNSSETRKKIALVIIAVLFAIGIKLLIIFTSSVPFHADEAVVSLMARHILLGERPVFFYGQAYMGSLDAWLISVGFFVFGVKVWVIRIVQVTLYAFTLITTVWIGKLAFDNWWVGIFAIWLLAVPNLNVTLYTTASLGGYGEALLIGNLIIGLSLVIGDRVHRNASVPLVLWFLWGMLAGLGLWTFGLTLVYSVPSGAFLIYCLFTNSIKQRMGRSKLIKQLFTGFVPILIGFLVGSTPWWLYLLNQDMLSPFTELGGQAIKGIEAGNWLSRLGQHSLSLLLLGSPVIFGIRPPWDFTWIALPLLPFALIFWISVIIHIFRSGERFRRMNRAPNLLIWIAIVVLFGFLLTPFGADPSGRYFLPLAIILAIFAGDMLWSWRLKIGEGIWAIIGLITIYHSWGILQSVNKNPPGITTQYYSVARLDTSHLSELISFLNDHGETRGYTNYWVSYPLAFLSDEELIYVPALPYHLDFRYTTRDNRYLPFDQAVSKSDKVAYITTNHPDLDVLLREKFLASGATWREKRIGDYHVFYELSKPIRANDIGLGVNYP